MSDLRPRHEHQLTALAASLSGNDQTIRIKKKTVSNLFRYQGREKNNARTVDLSGFNRPLFIDTTEATLDVQGLTTYETIVDFTLKHGYAPTIAPGLKHITVAGAIAGVGIESNCAKYGFVHDGLLEADVLLPSGQIVTCTPKNKYADLFHALPNSYGTLGYILRAKIKLRSVRPYVILDTARESDMHTLLSNMKLAAEDNNVDYVESLAYGKDKLYLTVGRQSDEVPQKRLSIYGKTVFYKEISRPGKLVLTTKDYIFRYDPEWFWALPKSWLVSVFRRFAPASMRNSRLYTRVMFSRFAKALNIGPAPGFELLIQDWEVPWGEAEGLFNYALDTVDLAGRPWLSGPIKSSGTATLYPATQNKLYLNLGCYGSARKKPGIEPYMNTKLMDAYCIEHGGIKMLYSSSFMDKPTFDKLYNGKAYRKIKAKYDPDGLAPSLYEKAVR